MQSLLSWAKANQVHPSSPAARSRLAAAYKAVFSFNATEEDRDLVLVDLAVFTRFYDVMEPDALSEGLRHAEGRRAVMKLITGQIADPRLLGELQMAASEEAQT
jgi:hypothetical protein